MPDPPGVPEYAYLALVVRGSSRPRLSLGPLMISAGARFTVATSLLIDGALSLTKLLKR
jgi:hypothetical protein